MSYFTPYLADDYQHLERIGARHDRVASIKQVVSYMVRSYQIKNSRMGEFTAFLVLHVLSITGRWLWAVLNPLVLASLILAMFFHVHVRMPSLRSLSDLCTLIALCASVFLLLPIPGNTVFWITGSVNYMWMASATLWFLAPYRMRLFVRQVQILRNGSSVKRRTHGVQALLMFCLGLYTGWGNENISPAVIVVLGALLLYYAFGAMRRREMHAWWMYAGFCGFIVGAYFMLAASGLAARGKDVVDFLDAGKNSGSVITWHALFNIEKWKYIVLRLYGSNIAPIWLFALPALCMSIVCKVFRSASGKPVLGVFGVYFLISSFATAVQIFSPGYSVRMFFGVACFLIIGVFVLYSGIQVNGETISRYLLTCVRFKKVWFLFMALIALVPVWAVVVPAYYYFTQRHAYNVGVLQARAQEGEGAVAVLDSADALSDATACRLRIDITYRACSRRLRRPLIIFRARYSTT